MCLYLFYLGLVILTEVQCLMLNQPQFESDWLPLVAQTTDSDLLVPHGLEIVPEMVEVLVQATDGPNQGFIFKGTGSCIRDDDNPALYGGIMYIYNEVNVRVLAPNRYNNQRIGSAIYTGEAPYWIGLNNQRSFRVEVKVRCWSAVSPVPPCLHIEDIYMKAGSSIVEETYQELQHNITGVPSLVKVRAKMIDGPDADWYTDAQGSSVQNLLKHTSVKRTGGVKFSYNNSTIRIWTTSDAMGVIFNREDGWGNGVVRVGAPVEGSVEVKAWCSLVYSYEIKVPFGPDVNDEQFQIPLPAREYFLDFMFMSALIQATDGPNDGFFFEDVGSVATNAYNIGEPCAYGGLLYAYNDTTIRFWRPDHATGAAVCIPDKMGHGINSQAVKSGHLYFRIFEAYLPPPAEEYSFTTGCSHNNVQRNSSNTSR